MAHVQGSDLRRSRDRARRPASFRMSTMVGAGDEGVVEANSSAVRFSATRAAITATDATIAGGGEDSILACHRKMASGGVAKWGRDTRGARYAGGVDASGGGERPVPSCTVCSHSVCVARKSSGSHLHCEALHAAHHRIPYSSHRRRSSHRCGLHRQSQPPPVDGGCDIGDAEASLA
jgi:hypothetical protein